MTSGEIKQIVIRELQQLPFYKANSANIQHVVRCPYCGDSRNPTHGHFSIKIDCDDPATPMMYRCLKCDSHGLLTEDVLDDLGLHVSVMDKQSLKLFNRKVAKHNKLTDTKIEQFDLIDYSSNYDRVAYKIDYINMRLGTNISASDLVKLRIVPNILDFMQINNMQYIDGVSNAQLGFYNRNYVGFISYNKNQVTLRDITNTASYRYAKLVLNRKNIDPNGFYSISNGIDLLYTEPINIHIAEGIFDILSVYANVNNSNLVNNYYYAICGFGYSNIIKSIIRMGINSHLNIHIYSDNDKSDYEIIRQIQNSGVMLWIDHLYIHRNGYPGMKDYGVTPESINDTIRCIK